ncbi:unnamed protein product [Notodromas monacha]|uniref:Uncharacterized protein n=1 Tax=Notodromas monacha TaxID=399045 RepID=A0A7R9BTF7_9CRUS|nr:unnamed protein product [Notodromas monacha]CAG0921426.1 unnamed protein product [Notodromas monacha]
MGSVKIVSDLIVSDTTVQIVSDLSRPRHVGTTTIEVFSSASEYVIFRSPTQKRLQLSEKDKNPEFHTSKESSSSFASSSTSSVELMMGGVRGDGGNGGDAFSSAVQDHDSSSALLITDLCHQLPVISKTLLERYLEGLDYTGNKCMMSASQSARTSRDISEEPVESGYQTDMNNSPDFVKHHHYHDGSSLGMRHDTPDSSVGGAEGVMSHFRPEDEDDTMSRNHVIDRNMLNIGANHRHRPDLNVADNGLDCSAPSSSVAKTLLNKRNHNGKGGCHQRRFESGTGAADDEVIDDDGHSIATQGCNVYETHYIHDDPLNGVLVGRDGKPTSHAGNKRRLEMAKEATIITSRNGTAVDPTVSHSETTQNLQDPQQAMEELKAIAMQGLATDSLDWDLVRTKLHCLAAITSTDTYPEIAEKPTTPIVVLLQGRRAVFPCGAARSVLLGDSSFTLIDESGVRFFPARKSVVTRRMAELIATEEEEEEGGRDGMRGCRRQMTPHHGLRGDDHVQKQHQEQEREKKAPRAKYPEIRAFLARQRAQHLRRT